MNRLACIMIAVSLTACAPELPTEDRGEDRRLEEACALDAGYCIGTGTEGFPCCPTAEVDWCAPDFACTADSVGFSCWIRPVVAD